MSQRSFAATSGPLIDSLGNLQVGQLIYATLLVPSGDNAIDGAGNIISKKVVSATTNSSGIATFATLDYPGDFATANCTYQFNELGILTTAPVGFSYASSIAISSWYGSAPASGTLKMIATLEDVTETGITNRNARVYLSQNGIDTVSGAIYSTSVPITEPFDGSGNIAFYLTPTANINPSGTYYRLIIDNEPTVFPFTVPTTPTGYQGAWNSGTTYHVNAGTQASPSDVVLLGGVYYQAIANSLNHTPPNVTYWRVLPGEPIVWDLTTPVTAGTLALSTTTIAHDANVPPLTGDPVQSPATLDDDLRNLAFRTGLALTWLGAWSSSTAYRTYDVVEQAGTSYVAILAGTNQNPSSSPTYWTAIGGGGGGDATETTPGAVLIDQTTTASHPQALTTPRLAAPYGVATLGGDGSISSFELPTVGGAVSEAGRWLESGSVPLIVNDHSFDTVAVNEPFVLYHQGLFKLWYTGASDSTETHDTICYATCPGTSDPMTAANWTKHGVVITAPALEANVFVKQDGTLRMFHSDHQNLLVKDSTDGGTTWTAVGTALAVGTSGVNWWAQSTVWQDATGLWQGLFEGGGTTGPWHIYHGTSTTGVAFTLDGAGMITSLVTGAGGGSTMEGGPFLPVPNRHNGTYHLWYHSSASGATPIQIYHATSTDLVNWTITNSGSPIITSTGIVDNPCILEHNGISYLFWGGGSTAGLHITKFGGTLAQLVSGTDLTVGLGTVTSVALTVPAYQTVTGSPITTSGTLAIADNVQAQNTGLFGPTAGAPALPTYRTMVPLDMPIATTSTRGAVQADGSTITITAGGVISASASGSTLASLSDANISSPHDQDVLIYRSSDSKWHNVDPTLAGGGAIYWAPLTDSTGGLITAPDGSCIMVPAAV